MSGRPHPDRLVLAGDLGGTWMRLAVYDAAGVYVAAARERTPLDDPDALARLARRVLAEAAAARAGGAAPDACVIGVPGPVSYESGRPLQLPQLPAWHGRLTAQSLADALGVPVLIANDADLGALGEHRFGAGRGTRDLLYVTVSTGVGAGVILGGRLLHGRRSLAEVGWTSVDRDSDAIVEHEASGTALAQRGAAAGAVLMARASAGDATALAAFSAVAAVLATAVMNAVVCFMPERVVIGGGVSAAAELLLPAMRARIARIGPGLAITPDVVPASTGDDAGLLGAFALWQDIAGNAETLAFTHPRHGARVRPGTPL